MPAPNSSLYRTTNKLANGQLFERITELRQDGMSWNRIALMVGRFTGVELTGVTVRNWADELGIEPREPVAS